MYLWTSKDTKLLNLDELTELQKNTPGCCTWCCHLFAPSFQTKLKEKKKKSNVFLK